MAEGASGSKRYAGSKRYGSKRYVDPNSREAAAKGQLLAAGSFSMPSRRTMALEAIAVELAALNDLLGKR